MRQLIVGGAWLLLMAASAWAQDQAPRGKGESGRMDAERILRRLDTNSDGVVDRSEAQGPIRARFDELDSNKDGKLDKTELDRLAGKLGGRPSQATGKRGEVNTPPARGERPTERLKVGDSAPDFSLPDPAGKKETRLSSFQGQKPVVLVFGSFT